jgi:hypothetical protein
MSGRRGSRLNASVTMPLALVPAAAPMLAACGGANPVTTSQDAIPLPAPPIAGRGGPMNTAITGRAPREDAGRR